MNPTILDSDVFGGYLDQWIKDQGYDLIKYQNYNIWFKTNEIDLACHTYDNLRLATIDQKIYVWASSKWHKILDLEISDPEFFDKLDGILKNLGVNRIGKS